MTDFDDWESPMAGLAWDQANRFNMDYAEELTPDAYEQQGRAIQERAQTPRPKAPQHTRRYKQ